MNKQREVIYSQRRQILSGVNLEEDLMDMAAELVDEIVEEYTANKMPEEWDLKALGDATYRQFGFRVSLENLDGDLDHDINDILFDLVEKRFAAKRDEIGPELFRRVAADGHAPGRGQPLERPPPVHGPPEGRHRASGLRPG